MLLWCCAAIAAEDVPAAQLARSLTLETNCLSPQEYRLCCRDRDTAHGNGTPLNTMDLTRELPGTLRLLRHSGGLGGAVGNSAPSKTNSQLGGSNKDQEPLSGPVALLALYRTFERWWARQQPATQITYMCITVAWEANHRLILYLPVDASLAFYNKVILFWSISSVAFWL